MTLPFRPRPPSRGEARIGGRPCAVGLDWYLANGGPPTVRGWLSYARDLDYDRAAIRGGESGQAGFGQADAGHRAGLPAAAAAAAMAAPPGIQTWLGLLPLDDGRWLHVETSGGRVCPSGDAVRLSAEDATAAFAAARRHEWDALYAPAELELPDTAPFPLGRLAAAWRAAPRVRETAAVTRPMRWGAALGAAGLAAALLWPALQDRWLSPAEIAEAVTAPPPKRPPPGIDSGAFLAGCAAARLRAEIPLPGWNRAETVCGDRLPSRGLAGSEEGALLVHWSHGRPVPRLRRVAEARLAGLREAQGVVDDRDAFAAAPVAGYRLEELPLGRSLREVRREIDERLGPIAESFELRQASDVAVGRRVIPFDEWRLTLRTRHPVAELMNRPVAHLEWTRLRWVGDGELVAAGRIRINRGLRAATERE